MGKMVKGCGRYRLPVTEGVSHWSKRHSIKNILSDTVIAFYVDGW